jgi:hypothetical protein
MTEHILSDSLFIIGAGAHVPYLMPTSADLRSSLKEMYSCMGPWKLDNKHVEDPILRKKKHLFKVAFDLKIVAKALSTLLPQITSADPLPEVSHEISNKWFNAFLKSFCESHVVSIDAYLSNISHEKNIEKKLIYSEMGKLAIAYLITEAERSNYLGTRADDWIHFFINQYIKKDIALFFSMPPKFLTFNYDRIFERMLFTHLVEYHRKSSNEAKELVDSLQIFHIYGDLGDYSEWHEDVSDESLCIFYSNAMARIHVIGDERASNKRIEIQREISRRYESTDNIYFLGYGFDEENNKLLTNSFPIRNWANSKNTYSTTIGIKRADISRIEKTLRTTKMFKINQHGALIEELYCSDLITSVTSLKLK